MLTPKRWGKVSAQTAAAVRETVIETTASRSRTGRSMVRIAGTVLRGRVKSRSIEFGVGGWGDEQVSE